MVYFNQNLASDEKAWSAKNGATRRELIVINKLGKEIETGVDCRIGKLDKGNHSFLFLNPGHDDRVLGVFLLNGYGYTVKEGEEVWTASSVGGYGNSESRIGIYSVGTLIYTHTYKNRRAGEYFRLTENGWEEVPTHEVESKEVEYV
jgi:hypothetical protein